MVDLDVGVDHVVGVDSSDVGIGVSDVGPAAVDDGYVGAVMGMVVVLPPGRAKELTHRLHLGPILQRRWVNKNFTQDSPDALMVAGRDICIRDLLQA